MNLLFPDRDRLTRDPLGFLLGKAESASAPLVPLALGYHRVFLVTDLAFISDGPFCPGTLRVPASPSTVFSPIEMGQACIRPRSAQSKTATGSEDCTKIINGITHELLIGMRKGIFSAYRHASFDCWSFSRLLAARLTFIALFGSNSEDVTDPQNFLHHSDVIHSFKDLIALDYICERRRQRSEKEQACKHSLQSILSEARRAFSHRKDLSISSYAYKTIDSCAEILHLALAIQQTTAAAFFWALFALSSTQSLRKIVEEEADACLSSDGDLSNDKLHYAGITRSISLEILRLAQTNNIIVFICKSPSIFLNQEFHDSDKFIVLPHIIFRSNRYFANAKNMIIGRKYDKDFFILQNISCGGGIVYQLALLNLTLLLLDLSAAFEIELVEGPSEFNALPSFRATRPDIKIRLNLRRSRLFR